MTPTTKSAGDRLLLFVAAFGAGISLLILSLSGAFAGLSSAVGSTLALLNLMVLRTIVFRLIEGEVHAKLPFVALIFVKMGVLMGLVFVFITRHWVEPIAFTLGLSSLVVGMIAGSLSLARSGTRNEY